MKQTHEILKWTKKHALYIAWLIALIGFCLSVFYGEILRNPPCPLCWYQRIALFPLVILLGLAAYKGETMIVPYVLPIVVFGGIVAGFHLLQPYVPFLQKASVCSLGVQCSHAAFRLFGVNGLSFLSAIGFFLIALILLSVKKRGSYF